MVSRGDYRMCQRILREVGCEIGICAVDRHLFGTSMSYIFPCPHCGKSIRIPAEKSAKVVKCPSCGNKFRAAAEFAEDELHEFPPRARQPTKRKSAVHLQPFLRRWMMACGIVLGIAALIGIGGLYSEVLAITATAICIAGIVICLLTGRIWMAIDLGRDRLLYGIIAFIVPVAGVVLSFQRKGPSLRGAVVFVSVLAPTILCGLMLLVFYPKYTPTGQRATQTAKWEDLMRQLDNQVRPETPTVTVTVRVASRPGSLDGIQPRCEALLSPYKSYVPGSLKIDAPGRTLTYQYRGSESFATMIAFYLGSATGAFTPQGQIKSEHP